MAENQISEVQIEIGCKAFGIEQRERHALVVYNLDEGVPESELTDLVQLSKIKVSRVVVAPVYTNESWCDITPLLSEEELSEIGTSIITDIQYGSTESGPVH